MAKTTISMVIFNSYVKLPEGTIFGQWIIWDNHEQYLLKDYHFLSQTDEFPMDCDFSSIYEGIISPYSNG